MSRKYIRTGRARRKMIDMWRIQRSGETSAARLAGSPP
jgi:hypothetical protein